MGTHRELGLKDNEVLSLKELDPPDLRLITPPWPCAPTPHLMPPFLALGPLGAGRGPAPGPRPGCGGQVRATRGKAPQIWAGGLGEPFPGRYFGPFCELCGAGGCPAGYFCS